MSNAPSGGDFLFAADSTIWRISRENILLLGGPAAAILQIAHPQVALGVAAHSDFRNDALGRLLRTLDGVYTITFAPREEAQAMAEHVRAIHARVKGNSPQPYSAFSQEAQMWVLATLIGTSVQLYERWIKPLTAADKESYFKDMRTFGACFGLSREQGPQDWESFMSYYGSMLASPHLASLPISAELAGYVAHPRRPYVFKILSPVSAVLARAFIPEPLRGRLALPPVPCESAMIRLMDAVVPRLLPALPARIRYAPKYLHAMRNLAKA